MGRDTERETGRAQIMYFALLQLSRDLRGQDQRSNLPLQES